MGHGLGARAELKHRKNLGEGIDGQPEPEDLVGAAQPGSEFVQLEMRDVETAEAALVEGLSVFPSAGQPGGDGGLSVAEDPLGGGSIQSFGQRREHHGDLLGRSFQAIQGGVAPGSERGMAGLAAKCLDPLSRAMLAIADQSVDLSIGDAEVGALRVGTGEVFGVDPLGRSPAAFDLAPRAHRHRSKSHNTRVGAGEATGGAIVWGAGFEKTLHRGALGPSS